jgi:hypothetical protein
MKKFIFSIAIAVLLAFVVDASVGVAGTRYAMVEFVYEGLSYYTPRDFCMVMLYSNPDSVVASGRILERNNTYYFEFEVIDGEEFGPDNLHNYIRIWAYTDSIQESRLITPFLPSSREVNFRFYFGDLPNCYGIGGGGNPGGP